MTRSHIHVLAKAEHTQADIAARLDVGERSVRRIVHEPEPTPEEVCADRRVDAPRLGRPPKADQLTVARVQQFLAEDPKMRATEAYRRAVEWGYTGRRSAMSELVRRLRPTPATDVVVRFEGLPGEYGQFDFGEAIVTYTDGRKEKILFFAGRLKFSRLVHVVMVRNQTAETVVRSLVETFEAWGGAPREWVFDNPRTIRASLPGVVPVRTHDHLRDLLAEMRGIPTFCLPAHGNQKGSVENLVGFVKPGFFFARRFRDRADVASQLVEWLHDVNHVRPCRATDEIPAVRFERERDLLRALPAHIRSENYAIRVQRVVSPSALVHHTSTPYAVDPAAVGHTVDLLVRRDTIEIVDQGRVVGRHTRHDRRGSVVRTREDRHDTLKVIGGRQTGFFKRECVRELGEAAEEFLTRLVHADEPSVWHEPVAELFDMLQEHGDARVLVAITACVRARTITAVAVRRALAKAAA